MSNFEEYVEKYAKKHNVSPEEAKKHAIVREVEKHYKSSDNSYYKWW